MHNVHSGETAFLCAEIKPQDLFFILKGHSRDLILDTHKVGGPVRVGFKKKKKKKRMVKSDAAEDIYSDF